MISSTVSSTHHLSSSPNYHSMSTLRAKRKRPILCLSLLSFNNHNTQISRPPTFYFLHYVLYPSLTLPLWISSHFLLLLPVRNHPYLVLVLNLTYIPFYFLHTSLKCVLIFPSEPLSWPGSANPRMERTTRDRRIREYRWSVVSAWGGVFRTASFLHFHLYLFFFISISSLCLFSFAHSFHVIF